MLWSGIAAASCLAAAAWSFQRRGDPRSPSVVVSLTWGLTLIAYAASSGFVPSLRPETGILLGAGPWMFAVAAEVADGRGRASRREGKTPPAPRVVGDLLLALAVLGLPFLVLRVLEAGQDGPTGNALVNIRLAASEGGEDALGSLAYLINFAIFAAGLHVLGLVSTSRARVVLMVAVALAYCVVTTGRTHFTMLLALLGGGLVISGRMRFRTFVATFLGVFALVFLVMGFLLGKIVGDDSAVVGALGTSLLSYLIGGIAALNDFLKTSEPWVWGENAGRTLIAILHRVGIGPEPRALVKEFRTVGLETNVYTVYRPYFEDFGWPGALGAQAAFGYLSGAAYARARTGNRAGAFAYGLLLYPALMQVFQDQYFSLLSTWVQAAALLGLVAYLASRAASAGALSDGNGLEVK